MRNLYPHRNAKRQSLMELRRNHLQHVDSMARSDESPEDMQKSLLQFFDQCCGRLRSRRRDEVPSDSIRKLIMVWQILDLAEERREELAALPKRSAQELETALAAAPNEYVRAAIRLGYL